MPTTHEAEEWMDKLLAKYQQLHDDRVEELKKENKKLEVEAQLAMLNHTNMPPIPTPMSYPICPCGNNFKGVN